MVRQVRSDKTVGKLEESAGLPNGCHPEQGWQKHTF